MPPHHRPPSASPLPAFLAPLPTSLPCRSLRLLLPHTMSHCRPLCTFAPVNHRDVSPRRPGRRMIKSGARKKRSEGMKGRTGRRDKETMYRPAIRESQRGPHSVRSLSTNFHRQTSYGSAKSACSRSSYPGRGADGCRATAVGGAFGRAYFPAMPAPTTVPRSIDRCHRRRRQRGRRRRAVVRGEPRKLWSPCVPSSLKGIPLAPRDYLDVQFIAVSVSLDVV